MVNPSRSYNNDDSNAEAYRINKFRNGFKQRGRGYGNNSFTSYKCNRYGDRVQYSSFRYQRPRNKHSRYKHDKSSDGHHSRPDSPVLGSEEYMKRKIQQTSAIIMRHLLNPEEDIVPLDADLKEKESTEKTENMLECRSEKNEKLNDSTSNKNKIEKIQYDIGEIHNKIMSHITNMNDGKKKNLINSETSGYDIAIQRIQKQKRLEISQALRDMCSKHTQESTDFINSIIPDIGIKIEELPRNLIEELRNTLNLDLDDDDMAVHNTSQTDFINEDKHLSPNLTVPENLNSVNIKQEPVDGPIFSSDSTDMETNTDSFKIKLEVANKEQFEDGFAQSFVILNEICHGQPDKIIINEGNKSMAEELVLVNSEEENVDKGNKDSHKKESVEKSNTNHETNHYDEESITAKIKTNDLVEENIYKNNTNNYEKKMIDEVNTNDQFEDAKNNIELSDIEIATEIPKKYTFLEKTNLAVSVDNSSQTDDNVFVRAKNCIDTFIEGLKNPRNLTEIVDRMFFIDKCVLKLTKYRQSLIKSYKDNETLTNSSNGNDSIRKNLEDIRTTKKRKAGCLGTVNKPKSKSTNGKNLEKKTAKSSNVITKFSISKKKNKKKTKEKEENADIISKQNLLDFQEVNEKILFLKIVENKLIAATESGKIFFCNLEDGHYSQVLEVAKTPITSLFFWKCINDNTIRMYVGAFDGTLFIYNFYNRSLLNSSLMEDSIMCMDSKWGYIFMGCFRGMLLRYSLEKEKFEYSDRLGDSSILVLKATQEGARRVLLVGTRNAPICIRDAISGLYMRNLDDIYAPTVYSLLLENNLVYCGTTSHDILIFSFHEGKLIHKHSASNSKGIGCMKIIKNLLFASCHNGSIFIYDTINHKYVGSIQGPGGVILSMEVLENQVMVGTMSFKFKSIPIPDDILRHYKN